MTGTAKTPEDQKRARNFKIYKRHIKIEIDKKKHGRGLDLTLQQAKNRLDKLVYYLPDALPQHPRPGMLPARLKYMHALAPDHPTVQVVSKRQICYECNEEPTILRDPRSQCALKISSAFLFSFQGCWVAAGFVPRILLPSVSQILFGRLDV